MEEQKFLSEVSTSLKKTKNFFKKLGFKKIIKLLAFILYTILIILITYAVINTFFKPKPEVITIASSTSDEVGGKADVAVLEKTLKENAQLSTAKLKFKAEAEYSGKGIPGINQTEFTVLCEAVVKAGFDMNNVIVEVNDEEKRVYITIPPAEIKAEDVYINHQNLKFYDKKFVLFPVNVQEHTAKALNLAENVAKNYAHETGILEMADKQGAEIIKGILSDAIPNGYKIEIVKPKK